MNQWLFHLSFIIFNRIHSSSSSLLRIPYYITYFSNEVQICPGSNSNFTYVELHLESEHSWLSFDALNEFATNTSIIINDNISFSYNNNTYKGKEIEDSIGFLNQQKVKLQFYIAIKPASSFSWSLNGALGMAYSFSDPKSSLIHQYKQNGLIDNLSFSILSNYSILLGGIDEENTKNHFHSYCNVLGVNNSWNCELQEVKLLNSATEINYPMRKNSIVTFTTETSRNYVPHGFIDLLMNEFFNERIAKKKFRQYNSTDSNKIIISTSYDEIMNFGSLSFYIDGFCYSVKLSEFWECFDLVCQWTMFENPFGEHWVLGQQFYKMYNTLFDYENKQIHFYSKNGVSAVQNALSQVDKIKVLFKTNMSIISIGLCCIFILKWKIVIL